MPLEPLKLLFYYKLFKFVLNNLTIEQKNNEEFSCTNIKDSASIYWKLFFKSLEILNSIYNNNQIFK